MHNPPPARHRGGVRGGRLHKEGQGSDEDPSSITVAGDGADSRGRRIHRSRSGLTKTKNTSHGNRLPDTYSRVRRKSTAHSSDSRLAYVDKFAVIPQFHSTSFARTFRQFSQLLPQSGTSQVQDLSSLVFTRIPNRNLRTLALLIGYSEATMIGNAASTIRKYLAITTKSNPTT